MPRFESVPLVGSEGGYNVMIQVEKQMSDVPLWERFREFDRDGKRVTELSKKGYYRGGSPSGFYRGEWINGHDNLIPRTAFLKFTEAMHAARAGYGVMPENGAGPAKWKDGKLVWADGMSSDVQITAALLDARFEILAKKCSTCGRE
jgi:hypothetical protein